MAEKTFDDILSEMLAAYDSKGEKPMDEFIAEQLQSYGIDDETKNLIAETNEEIDGIESNWADLDKAKENGKSRKSWFMAKVDKLLEGKTEEEKLLVVNTITESMEKAENDLLNQ
jgi:hypothetical protein